VSQKQDLGWLNLVPSGWSTGHLRWLTRRFAGGTPNKDDESYWADGTIPWLNSGAVNQFTVTEASAYITDKGFQNSSAKWISEGALVMALAGQGKTKGMVAQLAMATTCNQSMAAIVPGAELDARYLLWWLTSNYQNIRNMAGGDDRDGLNLELLGNIVCPLPPVPQQIAIAKFLDRETGKIDALVEEQRRLIEVLREKRRAVISHAVTKGLDANAKMKPSGVDWLGDVPEHWEVSRLKHVLEAPLQYGANEAAEEDDRDNPRFVRITDIDEQGNLRDETFRSLKPDLAAPYILDDGDVLLARSGATVGKSFLYQHSWGVCCFAGYLIRARPRKTSLLPEFLFASCQSDFYWNHIAGEQIQSTIQNVSAERYGNFWLALPPLVEQREICDYLADQINRFSELTRAAVRAVELLQERRSALISAAVTGAVDIRQLVKVETVAA